MLEVSRFPSKKKKKKMCSQKLFAPSYSANYFFAARVVGEILRWKIINLFLLKNYQFSRYFNLNLSTRANNNLRHWCPPPNQTNFINIFSYKINRLRDISICRDKGNTLHIFAHVFFFTILWLYFLTRRTESQVDDFDVIMRIGGLVRPRKRTHVWISVT